MRGCGVMSAFFDLKKGGLSVSRRFYDRTRIYLLGASLGEVETLIVITIYTSQYGLSTAELAPAGFDLERCRFSSVLKTPPICLLV